MLVFLQGMIDTNKPTSSPNDPRKQGGLKKALYSFLPVILLLIGAVVFMAPWAYPEFTAWLLGVYTGDPVHDQWNGFTMIPLFVFVGLSIMAAALTWAVVQWGNRRS